MRRVRTNDKYRKWKGVVAVLISMVITSVGLADMMATNSAGVRAGITGIVFRPAAYGAGDTVGLQFAVRDPSETNVTTLVFQRSPNLTNWTDYLSLTVTGNYPIAGMGSAEAPDLVTPTPQFYRIRLLNF
ncbi:MAG TPA: hypothetical protein VL486_07835 [Verrucomicrobiae bacterium]|nr:hypothetical protein [Verrucomicrobiae bacterium]